MTKAITTATLFFFTSMTAIFLRMEASLQPTFACKQKYLFTIASKPKGRSSTDYASISSFGPYPIFTIATLNLDLKNNTNICVQSIFYFIVNESKSLKLIISYVPSSECTPVASNSPESSILTRIYFVMISS